MQRFEVQGLGSMHLVIVGLGVPRCLRYDSIVGFVWTLCFGSWGLGIPVHVGYSCSCCENK